MKQDIKMEPLVSFMVSPAGRALRVAVGLGLMTYGISSKQKNSWILSLIGVETFAAGALDLCFAGPALGTSILGKEIRQALHMKHGFPQLGSTASSWTHA